MEKLHYCQWFIFCHLLLVLPASVYSKNHGNPANYLTSMINQNRTARKLPPLNVSPGLGCLALQYVEFCKGNCTDNNTVNCKPPEDDFNEVFAPNCGVELPTIGTLTGIIVGCRRKYLEPSLVFSDVLVKDKTSLSIVKNKSHTELGVGMVGVHKGPFFWCVLFSNGKTNSSFVLENRGAGIVQKKGCFSGDGISCSLGDRNVAVAGFSYVMSLSMLAAFVLKLM